VHMLKLFPSKLKCPPMGHVTRKRGEVWEVLVFYIICEQRGYVNSLKRDLFCYPQAQYPYQLVFDREPHRAYAYEADSLFEVLISIYNHKNLF